MESGDTGGSEVRRYRIEGCNHAWGDKNIHTDEELGRFFSRFLHKEEHFRQNR